MKKTYIRKRLEKRGYRVIELPDGSLIVKNPQNIGKKVKNYNQAKERYLAKHSWMYNFNIDRIFEEI